MQLAAGWGADDILSLLLLGASLLRLTAPQIIFCVTGAVRVLVHRTEFSMGPGSMFKIPRGNSYQIHNMTDIEAFMVFFQAREIAAVVDNDDEGDK